jgi:hypothetical protein
VGVAGGGVGTGLSLGAGVGAGSSVACWGSPLFAFWVKTSVTASGREQPEIKTIENARKTTNRVRKIFILLTSPIFKVRYFNYSTNHLKNQ